MSEGKKKNKQLLLIGSLPPTRSHAALLTQALAVAASENGIEVICLIDALAPPPYEGLPFRVVRPFDPFIQSGAADNWPRLFVAGSEGDSLPVIEALHAAPGAVISATHSLFNLALPWLQTSPDFPVDSPINFPENFNEWLAAKYGDAGSVIAEGFIKHRRLAKEMTGLIPALDLLLAPATCHLSLGQYQSGALEDAGFTPTLLDMPPAKRSNSQPSKSHGHIVVVGASPATENAVVDAQTSGVFPNALTVTFYDRYSEALSQEISTAKAVVILDGHQATFCPHFGQAATQISPVITAEQRWAQALPEGAHYSLEHPASPSSVVHAIAALGQVEGMADGVKANMEKWNTKKQQTADWAADILAAATTAPPAKLSALGPPATGTKIDTKKPVDKQATNITPAHSILALVGAVPTGPLLQHQYPTLNTEKCPRFMTPTTAHAVAAFMGLPAAQMLDNMGFEAPLIADTSSSELPPALANKTRAWKTIQPGLRHAKTALTFGCDVDGSIRSAEIGKNSDTVSWQFIIPPEIFDTLGTPKEIRAAYDVEAGIYWVYDPVRSSLKCALLTGGSGVLKFKGPAAHSFVVTDLASTKTTTRAASCAFNISNHGLALFKVAALPTADNNSPSLMKILAQDGLHLEWSLL